MADVIEIEEFRAHGYTDSVVVKTGTYADGRLAVYLDTTDGEPYAKASVNLAQYGLYPSADDLFFAPAYSEHLAIYQELLRHKVIEPTGAKHTFGYDAVAYEVRLGRAVTVLAPTVSAALVRQAVLGVLDTAYRRRYPVPVAVIDSLMVDLMTRGVDLSDAQAVRDTVRAGMRADWFHGDEVRRIARAVGVLSGPGRVAGPKH